MPHNMSGVLFLTRLEDGGRLISDLHILSVGVEAGGRAASVLAGAHVLDSC
jgi:hypothetical protein